MWLQYVVGGSSYPALPTSTAVTNNVDSLLLYEPLQIAAIMEQVWRSRINGSTIPYMPFTGWPQFLTSAILGKDTVNGNPNPNNSGWITGYTTPTTPIYQNALMPSGETFIEPLGQPGIGVLITGGNPSGSPTVWDHLGFAYIIETTKIVEIFRAVVEHVAFGESLGNLSAATRQFLRTTEWLVYSDAFPSSMLTSGNRLRRDDTANRMTIYYWMLGADLAHARELGPYERPAAANRDFFPILEDMLREVWIGIENAKNLSGINAADPTKISILARRLYDMMSSRRLSGQLAREEFTAVAKLSWLLLVLLSNNFVIQDLQCEAADPSERLHNIARRVNMTAHLKSKHLIDLAQPLSFLLQSIETGLLNTSAIAQTLYFPLNTQTELNAEVVIDEYSIATDIDLKSKPVSVTELTRASTPRLPPSRALPPPMTARASRAAPPRGNGRAP
jgi:hypothetical protein